MLNQDELVALRMLTRMGPLSNQQLRRLFGLGWRKTMLKLEMAGLVDSMDGNVGYQVTDQGMKAAA